MIKLNQKYQRNKLKQLNNTQKGKKYIYGKTNRILNMYVDKAHTFKIEPKPEDSQNISNSVNHGKSTLLTLYSPCFYFTVCLV